MCALSMVYDLYRDRFPQYPYVPTPAQPFTNPFQIPPIPPAAIDPTLVDELRALIVEFREAVKAAKLVDKMLGAENCEDPEKAKLEERVSALELQLSNSG